MEIDMRLDFEVNLGCEFKIYFREICVWKLLGLFFWVIL